MYHCDLWQCQAACLNFLWVLVQFNWLVPHWKRMRLVKCVEASRLQFEMWGTSHKVSSKMTCAIQCLHPAWVVAAQSAPAPANPALPLTAVMTKAKAAPKIGASRRSSSPKVSRKGSPAPTSTTSSPQVTTTAAAAADLDPLPEPQQRAQETVPVPDVPTTTHEDAKEVRCWRSHQPEEWREDGGEAWEEGWQAWREDWVQASTSESQD